MPFHSEVYQVVRAVVFQVAVRAVSVVYVQIPFLAAPLLI